MCKVLGNHQAMVFMFHMRKEKAIMLIRSENSNGEADKLKM
jgi:hypothetical protein